MSRRSDLVDQAKALDIKVPFGISNDDLEELIRLRQIEPSPDVQVLTQTRIPVREREWDPLSGYG